MAKPDCPDCEHGRRQHDVRGCTNREPDGSGLCPCTKTYHDLNRRDPWNRANPR